MDTQKHTTAFIDIQSLLIMGERQFHICDFKKLCQELRRKHDVKTFYLIGNIRSRLTRLVLDDLQLHELHQEGIEVDAYNWYENRTYSPMFLATEIARKAFTPDTSDAACIVVTANTETLSMLTFLRTSGHSVELLLPKTHPASNEIRLHVPLIDDIDISMEGPKIMDKICLNELYRLLHWSEEKDASPMRINIVHQLRRYSGITPQQSTFFLNALIHRGILREEKHQDAGPDGETFFTVHIEDESGFQKLLTA